MKNLLRPLLALGALVAAAAIAPAQIERLTLSEMVAKTDGAVLAEIVGRHVFVIDHPVDGPELYFTQLTLAGQSLIDGKPITVDVVYPGGFLDEERGVHNSEAPSEDDVKVGNTIVAFYRWTDNLGGDVRGNALFASHGGLFRTVDGPKGRVVLGRGDGYAIDKNKSVDALRASIQSVKGR